MTNPERRGLTLAVVLLTLALVAALVLPLANAARVEALAAGQRIAGLGHRLAAHSVLSLLPELLDRDRALRGQLEREGQARLSFALGALQVQVLIQDDTAKLPLALLAETANADRPAAAVLQNLSAELGLPRLVPVWATRTGWTGCLEDAFLAPSDRAIYGTCDQPGWVRAISPLGRAVHARGASAAVLRAALDDLAPGLGVDLALERDRDPDAGPDEWLGRLDLPEAARAAARQRLTRAAERWSVLVSTRRGSEVRHRYLVCAAQPPWPVWVDWVVAP